MEPVILAQTAGLGLLILLSAFVSSSEVALFYLDPLEVRRIGEVHPARAAQIERLRAKPTHFLSTILIGNTIVNVAVAALVYAMVQPWAPATRGEIIAVAITLLLLLVFGEIGPKRVAVAHPSFMASLYAPLLAFFVSLFKPLRLVLDRATRAFDHLFLPMGHELSEDEYETVLDLSGEAGVLGAQERAMLKGIMRLADLQARDVMTPRVDLVGIDLEDPGKDLVAAARRARVRQLPVYRGDLDRVEALLDCRRLLLNPHAGAEEAMQQPLFVPESCPLDRLLRDLLREKRRAAVVVEEYGGTAGLVTRGDILEEITGDIDDEQGGHELLFAQVGPHRWIIDGRVSLEELSDAFDLAFVEEGVDRIAGWLSARLERIPRPGDTVDAGRYRFSVRRMHRHRVTLVDMEEREPAP